jgi:hypothetical protein
MDLELEQAPTPLSLTESQGRKAQVAAGAATGKSSRLWSFTLANCMSRAIAVRGGDSCGDSTRGHRHCRP